MAPWSTVLSALTLSVAFHTANAQQQQALTTCPLLGPQYPKPTNITSNPIFQAAMQSMRETLDAGVASAPYNTTVFSIGVFAASEPDLAWQYHHTPAGLMSNGTQGARSVDADSVYRIGSISKLMTVLLFLIEEGDGKWGDPVAKYLPELEGLGSNASYAVPDWTEITLGDLAGQIAGLGRDYGLADLSVRNNSLLPPAITALLPELPEQEVPVCNYVATNGSFVACSDQQYLQGVANSGTIFRPASRAVYSNQAFAILGLVLSRMAGKPVEQLFNENLVDTLDLQATSFTVPNNTDNAVIPINSTIAGWDNNFGVFNPAGGNFASTNDFATVGRAILHRELLSPALTRRWLKRASFVNDLHQGVGLPWEIVRLEALNRTIDIYGKAGDWGVYSTLFAIIPDYNIGFTIFTAFDPLALPSAVSVRTEVPNLIAQPLVEAVDAVAKAQAVDNFAGTYASSASNSSLTIATDADSALRLTSWTHEGTDLYSYISTAAVPDIDWRLLPNDLYDGDDRVGFTSFFQIPAPERLIFGPCFDWASVDPLKFGNVPLGQFAFDVDANGRAAGIESLGLREKLDRKE